jgi:hypothetical protein
LPRDAAGLIVSALAGEALQAVERPTCRPCFDFLQTRNSWPSMGECARTVLEVRFRPYC